MLWSEIIEADDRYIKTLAKLFVNMSMFRAGKGTLGITNTILQNEVVHTSKATNLRGQTLNMSKPSARITLSFLQGATLIYELNASDTRETPYAITDTGLIVTEYMIKKGSLPKSILSHEMKLHNERNK